MIDLAILGGGPAGYVAAERAGRSGLSVTLFEMGELGGVCLNEGCIPTKALLYSAKIYDSALHGDKYGVVASEVKADYGRMADRKNRIVRRLVGGIAMKMREAGVTLIKGSAAIGGRTADGFRIDCNGESHDARNVLICTGSHKVMPLIPGIAEAGETVISSREMLVLKEMPRSLVVIGGGVIGMEFASLCNSLGSQVSVIEMLPEILTGMDAEQAATLREIYAKRGVKFMLSCKVTKIEGNKVFYTSADGQNGEAEGQKILLSVGRRPVTEGLGLETIGVELFKSGIKVDSKMRTNVAGVYAAGDVKGFSMLAHTASREGEVVANILTGRDDEMRYDAIPGVVYTNPELAGAGMTEDALQKSGIQYDKTTIPMSFSGRFMAENEGFAGACKLLTDKNSGRILGAHILGNPASEIIFGACMAIEQGMTAVDIEKVIFPHPTVSEILKEAAWASVAQAGHL